MALYEPLANSSTSYQATYGPRVYDEEAEITQL